MLFDESDGLPNDFDTMELIGDHMIQIGVPRDIDDQLKKYIIAAAKTYFLRNKSLDYTLKKYGGAWVFQEPSEDAVFVCYVLRQARQGTGKLFKRLASGGKIRPEHFGIFAAEMALARLQASFRCASILIGEYHSFEASTICRIILEQLAWAYRIHEENDVDKIIKIKPTKCISILKNIVTYAGNLYGRLSCLAHLYPKFNRHYVGFGESGAFVKLKSLEDTKIILYYYTLLCDILAIVLETISHKYLEKLEHIKIDNNKIILLDDRPSLILIEEIGNKIFTKL